MYSQKIIYAVPYWLITEITPKVIVKKLNDNDEMWYKWFLPQSILQGTQRYILTRKKIILLIFVFNIVSFHPY